MNGRMLFDVKNEEVSVKNNVIPELKNIIDEIMGHQHAILSDSVRDNLIKQEIARVNLARDQLNQQIQNIKNNLLAKLNNYIVQRQRYAFLKFRQWYYGKIDNQKNDKVVFSKSSSDLYSLAKYELALKLINKIYDYASMLDAQKELQRLADEIKAHSSTLAYYVQEICTYILSINKGLIIKKRFPQLNSIVNDLMKNKENEIHKFINEYFNKQIKAVEGVPEEYIKHLRTIKVAVEKLKMTEEELKKYPRKTYDEIYEEAYDDHDYGAWGFSDRQSTPEQVALAQRRYQKQEEQYQEVVREVAHRKILLDNVQLSALQYAKQKKLPSHLIAACTDALLLDEKDILQCIVGKNKYHQILEDVKISLYTQFGQKKLVVADCKMI